MTGDDEGIVDGVRLDQLWILGQFVGADRSDGERAVLDECLTSLGW